MQDLYYEYTRLQQNIKKYYEKISINSYVNEQLSKDNYEISKNINKYDEISKEINDILTKNKEKPNLEPFYSKLNLEYKNNKIQSEKMIITILEKIQSIGLDILNEEEIKNNNNFKRNDTLMKSIQIGKGELIDRKNMLEQRKKDLLEAQEIASHIKDVSKNINEKVNKDQEAFDAIEENVNILDNNTDGALNDLKEIQKMQKDRRKKLCIIWILIIVVVATFIIVIIALYWEKIRQIFKK